MAKYNRSNYTLNKFSTGIVYVFDSEIIEVTLEGYLKANSDKTELDFLKLKHVI